MRFLIVWTRGIEMESLNFAPTSLEVKNWSKPLFWIRSCEELPPVMGERNQTDVTARLFWGYARRAIMG